MDADANPIAVRVTRYRCPFCHRSHSSRARAAEHIQRCWRNPAARGCKTCKHFDATYEGYGEDCDLGVDLTGHPQCGTCHGVGTTWTEGPSWSAVTCKDCDGHAAEVKPGPIVHCALWEAVS